jgi:hypothetical protein
MDTPPLSVELPCYTIFQEPWWLDLVAPGSWEEVVLADGDTIVARWPMYWRQRWPLRISSQPPLTPYLGPWTISLDARARRAGTDKRLLQDLATKLPRTDVFRQIICHRVADALPFLWTGFSQTTSYTYRLAPANDPSKTWANLSEIIRRNIKKAGKSLQIEFEPDPERVYRLFALTLARSGKAMPYSLAVLQAAYEAVRVRKRGWLAAAVDEAGQYHAAAFFVGDATSTYYLAGGSDPSHRGSGAPSFLMHDAIARTHSEGRTFDFEGSTIPAVEAFFRKFGGELTPLHSLTKSSRIGWLANTVAGWSTASR